MENTSLNPVITIDEFSGSGKNGILYCSGLYPEIDNGKSSMGEGFRTLKSFDTNTTGLDGISTIKSILPLSTIRDDDKIYNLYYNGYNIFSYSEVYSSVVKTGRVHTTLGSISNPDFIETSDGGILYTQENYIGLGTRFKATGGSTTTIIDTTKNFVDEGIVSGDKVTNLKTGVEYTITSITTTTNTNDTLNFTASGTNTTVANDEIIAWNDNKFDITTTAANWQESRLVWSKQIKLYGDIYYFTNGNYIGKILSDGATVTKDFKQLPARHQALSIEVNNAKVLVSASVAGKGALLLWDGASDGWNNIIKLDRRVSALYPHQSGWVFVSNGEVYYTDGYQLQTIYGDNSKKLATSFEPENFNGITVYENILYICNSNVDINFTERGVYAIDLSNPNNGFTLINCTRNDRDGANPSCIGVINRFSNTSEIQVAGEHFCNTIRYGSVSGSKRDKSMILYANLKKPLKIRAIGLNIARPLNQYNNDISGDLSRDIQVSLGDGKRGLIGYTYTTSTGFYGTTLSVNGTQVKNNEIGDQFFSVTESSYGDRGEITNITGKGESGELWTITPAVSPVSPTSSNLKMLKVKSLGKKTVSYTNVKDELLFSNPNASFMSNKIFIEIVLFGQADPLPLNITQINIYGE
jgi:hypothetical protein